MQKIPTLYQRNMNTDKLVRNELVPGCEWVLAGEGYATEKIDGTSCLVQDEKFYKRYDAKKGKTPPVGFIPAQPEPDEITGHFPGWLLVGDGNEDKWHREGFQNSLGGAWLLSKSGTYELVGPKVQGNPYKLLTHQLWKHGHIWADEDNPEPPREFEALKEWLKDAQIEGLVWWHPDGRMAKIKRRDFGYEWPIK